MPQIINTNIPSLAAQNKLDRASEGLATSFKRLSSGLRINSAKDDAAGLAIATRFTSTISGLTVAKRNANDAISLAQVGEGALEEVTSILQRARELALQSANGSNSAADRKALQSEVNALKQELTRVSTTTTFNGNTILNGNLQNAQFQIGSEANKTVSVSIKNTQTSAIGTNALTSSNTDGIEQATHRAYIGGGLASDAVGLGSEVGVGADAVVNNYTAETLTVSNVNSAGITVNATAAVAANDDAATIAGNLNALGGVAATAFNKVTVSNVANTDDSFGVNLVVSGSGIDSSFQIMTQDTHDFSTIATTINADTDLQAAGVYAIANGTSLDIITTGGQDIRLESATASAGTFDVSSAFNGGGASTVVSDISHTRGGRVDVAMSQGYSLSTSAAGVFKNAVGAVTTTAVGVADLTGKNAVRAQNVIISGSTGSATVAISANDEASNIVTKVNAVSGTTNVKAKAITTVTLQGLSDDGTISFDLFGDNTAAAHITASVTTADLTTLVKAINDSAGNTGITAAIGTSNDKIILTHSTGKDIGIKDFTHTAAVMYQDPATTPVTTDGSTVVAPKVVSLQVIGNESTNAGHTVTLKKGGTAAMNGQDSTVVGGSVSFTSSAVFSMSSNIDGTGYVGSLFGVAPNGGNTSAASTVNTVDISTVAGANSAIAVLDDAMNQISEVRADLGAVQSRFESTIRNLSNNIENLNIARSRILDADFAAETAALAKNQILSSAGIAVLAQANGLPQSVLKLFS